MSLVEGLRLLEEIGLTDVLLPFILVFTITFAILDKANIFGENKKNINIVVSLVMGLLFVIPHVTGSYKGVDPVNLIKGALPAIAVITIAIIMVILLTGAFGAKGDFLAENYKTWIAVVALFIVAVIFASAAGWLGRLPWWLDFLRDSATQAAIILILFTGVLIYFIQK